jgi:hypothetical protein
MTLPRFRSDRGIPGFFIDLLLCQEESETSSAPAQPVAGIAGLIPSTLHGSET